MHHFLPFEDSVAIVRKKNEAAKMCEDLFLPLHYARYGAVNNTFTRIGWNKKKWIGTLITRI